MNSNKYDLTQGSILPQLIKVSLPVVATSFMQMFYNLTDIVWLGSATSNSDINTGYQASVGYGGFFTWLGAAVFLLVKIGTEVRVSQSVGRKDEESARVYARTAVQLEFIFALIYTLISFVFAHFWMSLFNINDSVVFDNSVVYLQIVSAGMIFYLMNPVFSATLNGTGNTKTPFLINGVGLALNMILDPIFILVFHWDIKGAALATSLSQVVVSLVFIGYFFYKNTLLSKANFLRKIDTHKAKDILRLGYPIAIQNALFTFIAMYMAGMVTQFGKPAMATQKIGSQVEALSWRAAGGVQTGLGTFVGQNYGAKQPYRVLRGIRYSLLLMIGYGVFVSLVMYFLAGPIFGIFSHDHRVIGQGIDYLHILAYSQLFMIIEALISGALNGLGITIPESINSLALNALRIPMAYFFIAYYGLNGIWIAVTISSVLKGSVIYVYYKIYIRHKEMFKGIHIPLLSKKKEVEAKI